MASSSRVTLPFFLIVTPPFFLISCFPMYPFQTPKIIDCNSVERKIEMNDHVHGITEIRDAQNGGCVGSCIAADYSHDP
jgi:hypothetical protein